MRLDRLLGFHPLKTHIYIYIYLWFVWVYIYRMYQLYTLWFGQSHLTQAALIENFFKTEKKEIISIPTGQGHKGERETESDWPLPQVLQDVRGTLRGNFTNGSAASEKCVKAFHLVPVNKPRSPPADRNSTFARLVISFFVPPFRGFSAAVVQWW